MATIMITFKQYITELFDGSNKFKYRFIANNISSSRSTVVASFVVNGERLDVEVEHSNNAITVDFMASGDYSLTNVNTLPETLKIYNTVIAIVREAVAAINESAVKKLNETGVKTRKMKVSFGAFDSKTIKIYKRMSIGLAKELGGKAENRAHIFNVNYTLKGAH